MSQLYVAILEDYNKESSHIIGKYSKLEEGIKSTIKYLIENLYLDKYNENTDDCDHFHKMDDEEFQLYLFDKYNWNNRKYKTQAIFDDLCREYGENHETKTIQTTYKDRTRVETITYVKNWNLVFRCESYESESDECDISD